jgi:hypothetical protein
MLLPVSGKEYSRRIKMNSNIKTARMAGFYYLLMLVFSGFAMMYVEPRLIISGDVDRTISNIRESELLFRLGFASNLIGQVSFLFLVHSLYKLFKPVDQDLSRLMVILVVASVPVAFLNLLNEFVPALLLSDAGYLSVFEPDQLQALSMVFLDVYKYGNYMAEIFWGLWLFPFGLLVVKSGFIPKVIGYLLMIACFGYLIEFLAVLFFPNNLAISSPGIAVAGIAEISTIFWLLIKGAKNLKLELAEAA